LLPRSVKDDIDALYAFLLEHEVKVVHPPEEGSWALGYYSVLFEDPKECGWRPTSFRKGAFRTPRAVTAEDYARL